MIAVAPGPKVAGAGDPVHVSVVVRAARAATVTVTGIGPGVADPALGPKRGRKKGLDPVNGKDGPSPGTEVKQAGKKGTGKRGPGPGTAKGPDAQGPEMVQVSRERAEQEGMIGPGSRSKMSPRTTRVGMGGMAMETTHRTTMTMEDTMLMSRLSMMTAKTVNHSPTVARTMSIEIQVLFTVE